MYTLEITVIFCYINLEQIYSLFGINSISPDIVLVKNLGHLEGLVPEYIEHLVIHIDLLADHRPRVYSLAPPFCPLRSEIKTQS